MKLTRGLNIPFLNRSVGLPPNSGDLSGFYFNKGFTGNEVINTKGTNADIVQGFCAEGDGVSGYINCGTVGACNGGSGYTESLTIAIQFGTIANFYIGEYLTAGNKRSWSISMSTAATSIRFGKADGTYKGLVSVPHDVNLATGDAVTVTVEASGSNLVITVYKNGVANGSGTFVGQNKIYCPPSGVADLYVNTYLASNFGDSQFCNVKIWNEAGLKINSPCDGSAHDISGNDNHGTVVGTVDLNARSDYSTFHNIHKGFDKYLNDLATAPYVDSDYIWVPYVNGVPVVASVAGYAKVSERPAYKAGNNNSECGFRFTDAIMDRSDVSIWTALARGTTYDSGDPFVWFSEDMTVSNLVSWLQPAYLERLYLATDETGYVHRVDGTVEIDPSGYSQSDPESTVTRFKNFLIYATTKTAPQDVKIVKWEDKSKYKEVT